MASLLDPQPPVDPYIEGFTVLKDTTLATASLGVFAGYPMGGAFSLFGAMISSETSTHAMGTGDFFRHSFRQAHRLGCSFAYFGLLFGGIEVALEKRRGKKDMWNPTISGGLMGGAYGWRSYRAPGLVAGCIVGGGISILFEKLANVMGFGYK